MQITERERGRQPKTRVSLSPRKKLQGVWNKDISHRFHEKDTNYYFGSVGSKE